MARLNAVSIHLGKALNTCNVAVPCRCTAITGAQEPVSRRPRPSSPRACSPTSPSRRPLPRQPLPRLRGRSRPTTNTRRGLPGEQPTPGGLQTGWARLGHGLYRRIGPDENVKLFLFFFLGSLFRLQSCRPQRTRPFSS